MVRQVTPAPSGIQSSIGSGEVDARAALAEVGHLIADRYRVVAVLGHGGMGAVYRVIDESTRHELALKHLYLAERARNRRVLEGLFEQEFRTLCELDHPRVIRVYDYGVDTSGPYYTMEMLDGSDLTHCTPISWQAACRLAHDVCSSLSLLHARGLIHRDVTPDNIRCTRDGRAKLIDFGAMTHTGVSEKLIGTPTFAAPEAANGAHLDARTDLYSLGATLYFALTGKPPYAAQSFSDLAGAWRLPPEHLSSLVPDAPVAFGALVMRLLALSPSGRPRSASEVMQHVAALAGLERSERVDVARAYLATPKLVGLAHLLSKVKQRMLRAARPGACHGSGLILFGAAGIGRSRALDACVLETKTTGAIALSTAAKTAGHSAFATMQLLAAQLVESLPQVALHAATQTETLGLLFEPPTPSTGMTVRQFASLTEPRAELQHALERFWLRVTEDSPLVLAVDDADRVDEPSSACLATLADRARHYPLLLLLTAQGSPDALHNALTQRCAHVNLRPLSRDQSEQLLQSLFGDVPNLRVVSERVFRIAQGSPRLCMELATHLVDRGVISYDAGTWIVPAELQASDLPTTLDEALLSRAESLTPDARWLAELHALSAYGALSLEDHATLDGRRDLGQWMRARGELLSNGVLHGDRQGFSIATDAWVNVLTQGMSESDQRERYMTLALLGQATDKSELSIIHHLFGAGATTRALDALLELLSSEDTRTQMTLIARSSMRAAAVAQLFAHALVEAERLGRRERELSELRRWLLVLSGVTDEEHYTLVAQAWLRTLKRDSGFDDWFAAPELADPTARLEHALRRASERYASTPESERVYGVRRAIEHLAQYAVTSIAYISRTFDRDVMRSLPGLLLPFVPLSPLMAAMHENALATCECMLDGRPLQARQRWQAVLEYLGRVPPDGLPYVDMVRNGVRFAVGTIEAARGIESAEQWATAIEDTPYQRVDALFLRRVIRLGDGDIEAAERLRREAELLAIRSGVKPMFQSMLYAELLAHAMMRDLSGVRHVTSQIQALADRHAGWLQYRYLAEGQLEFLRGDMHAAKDALERGLAVCTPDPNDPKRSINAWPYIAGAYVRTLVGLGQHEAARAFGLRALQELARFEISATEEVEQGLALAETRLGDYAHAVQRLDTLIEWQRGLGVVGPHLGASFETRARAAIWAKDAEAFAHFVRLTAHEYRHGRASGLSARCERLHEEAHRADLHRAPASLRLAEASSAPASADQQLDSHLVDCALLDATSPQLRAAAVLRLLCEVTRADTAHLYLIQPDGTLSWTAARVGPEPTPREQARATRYFNRVRSRGIGATVVSAGRAAGASVSNTSPAVSGQHVRHEQALLLTAADGNARRHVALVITISTEKYAVLPSEHPLLALLGARLWDAGDTPGLAL